MPERKPLVLISGTPSELPNGDKIAGTDLDLDWSEITNKPLTFAPDVHTHDWNSITDKPLEFEPVSHTHLMADITDLSISWTDVTGKPSTFAPESHTHVRADITDLGVIDPYFPTLVETTYEVPVNKSIVVSGDFELEGTLELNGTMALI